MSTGRIQWAVLVMVVALGGTLIHMYRYVYIERDPDRIAYVLRIDRLTGDACFVPDVAVRDLKKALSVPPCW